MSGRELTPTEEVGLYLHLDELKAEEQSSQAELLIQLFKGFNRGK